LKQAWTVSNTGKSRVSRFENKLGTSSVGYNRCPVADHLIVFHKSYVRRYEWKQMQWNQNELSQQFLCVAQNAEIYLAEISPKAKGNSAYRNLFDDHLAKFFVFNYLHGRTFLTSREQLVTELHRMLDFSYPGSGAFDAAEFERFRRVYIEQLMSEYTENK
jgi:hypothetical protein